MKFARVLLAVAGLVVLLTAPKAAAPTGAAIAPWLGPTSVGLRGSF